MKNRTIIGLICIVLALVLAFGIDFTASPLRLRQKQSSGFKDIVREFMEYQSRQKYNALRREKRRNERNG